MKIPLNDFLAEACQKNIDLSQVYIEVPSLHLELRILSYSRKLRGGIFEYVTPDNTTRSPLAFTAATLTYYRVRHVFLKGAEPGLRCKRKVVIRCEVW